MRVRGYAESTPCWITLRTEDVASTVAFYSGLFDWEYSDGVFRRNGCVTGGIVPETLRSHPLGWVIYVSTDDIERTVSSVVLGGGRVLEQPAEVPPGGLMSLCADPDGAVFGCWQRRSFAGTQIVNEPGTTFWNEVAVRDTSVAEGFYGKVFEWSSRLAAGPGGEQYTEWVVGGRVVAGMSNMDGLVPSEVPPHWRIIFEIDDAERTVQRCRELGGEVMAGPLTAGVGRYAQIRDPQGGTFGAVELVPELRDRL